jgi:hypothetical protein
MSKSRGIILLLLIIFVMLLISLYVGFSYKEGATAAVPAKPAAVPAKPPSAPPAGGTCSKSYPNDNAKDNAGQPTTYKCQRANKPVNCSNSQFKDNLNKIKNDYKNDKCFQTFLDKLPTSSGDFKNPTECDCDGLNVPNTKCTTKAMGDANICVKK